MKIGDLISLGLVAGVGALIIKNKDTLKSIGGGINSTVSGALTTIQSKVVKDAGKD